MEARFAKSRNRVLWAIVFVGIVWCRSIAALPAKPIDSSHYTDEAQYAFLQSATANAEVVSLVESIHVTHEFPLVRLGMIKQLKNEGFRTLAFEGSAADLWTTQDILLSSPRTPQDIHAAQRGLFPLWNTPEMYQIFEYEVASWASDNPFYITAYDVQPGTGQETRGAKVFQMLATQLSHYATPPAGFAIEQWAKILDPLTSACSQYSPMEQAQITAAITQLEGWTNTAAPEIQRRYPSLPHARILKLLPENLRASLRLCEGLGERTSHRDWSTYKDIRDAEASRYALELKEAIGNKLLLWAHASHLLYNGEAHPSVGELLHERLGDKVYTIALFATGGGTIVLFSDVNDLIGYTRIPAPPATLYEEISNLCPSDCFVDLRTSTSPAFTSSQKIWVENGLRPILLASAADAAVFIRGVHAPDMPLPKLLILGALAYVKPPRVWFVSATVGGAIVLAICVALLRRRKRMWRTQGHE